MITSLGGIYVSCSYYIDSSDEASNLCKKVDGIIDGVKPSMNSSTKVTAKGVTVAECFVVTVASVVTNGDYHSAMDKLLYVLSEAGLPLEQHALPVLE